MDYTYYVDEDGKVFRLHVETDDEPWNPREDMGGNIGTMFWDVYKRQLQGPKRSSANAEPYNRNPVGNNPLSSPEEFRRIIDSDGISDQDVSDLVRLMCKSAPGSCLKDVLRSRYLSADEKEEIRDIIDRALNCLLYTSRCV